MSRRAFNAEGIKPVGPYSHAVEAGGFVFISGQIGIDPETGKLADGDISAQTVQVFKNILSVLSAGGLTGQDVVKVTVFMTDMGNFAAMNRVYEGVFSPPYPARSTIGVASLPLGAGIEIEVVAGKKT